MPGLPHKTRDTVELRYDGTTVIIRNPDEGDTEQIIRKHNMNQTRGLNVSVFRRDVWSAYRKLVYPFQALTIAKATEIKEFIKASLGMPIELIDYHDRSWTVFITNPDVEFEDYDECRQKVTLEFEGSTALANPPAGFMTLVTPNPDLGNTEACVLETNIGRSIGGTTYTTVKSTDRKIYRYTFNLSYAKARELIDFLWLYEGQVIEFQGKTGYLQTLPEVAYDSSVSVSIELEEVS